MKSDVDDNMMATCNSIWNEVQRVQQEVKESTTYSNEYVEEVN
jgi:hypothetical protein